jgi:hypothetical protein
MSTEDIRIKLQADESGAVNSFRKLRTEVLNNEQGLKRLSDQGKITGKGLRDMAGMLGPEFGQLGNSIDQITGGLKNAQGAGMMAKGALVGMVAVAGFQVGKMIGDWVFETEKWKERLADARKEADRLNNKLFEGARERAAELSAAQIEQELSGTSQNIGEITDQINRLKREAEAWNLANTIGIGTQDRQNEIATLEQEREAARKTRDMYQKLLQEREKQAQQAREAQDAKRAAEEAKALEQAAAAAQRLIDTQEDYLFNLEAELVKVRDGEEAYLRLTLAKRGFTEESIKSAIALRAEITEMAEAAKLRDKDDTTGVGGSTISAPGQVQGTQQRFLTRGTGMTGQDKILEATRKQVDQQQAMLAEQKRQTQILEQRLPREAY